MITERMNPRRTVALWLAGLYRSAYNDTKDKDMQLTAEKVVELSEPILSMTAASVGAPTDKFRALLERDNYPARAEKYLEQNWVLNLGIPQGLGSMMGHQESARTGARETIEALRELQSEQGEVSAATMVDLTEAVARDLMEREKHRPQGRKLHSENTATLLREAIGLAGDMDVCLLDHDAERLDLARRALSQLGCPAPFKGEAPPEP